MLIETQAARSKSDLLKELLGPFVTKTVIYRYVETKAWEQIVKEQSGHDLVVLID